MANNVNNPIPTNNRINKHGLEYNRVSGRLKTMAKNAKETRPDEMVRYLVTLAFSIDEQITASTAQLLDVGEHKPE